MPLYNSAGFPVTALSNHGDRDRVVGSKRKVTDGTHCGNGVPAIIEHVMCPLKRQCLEMQCGPTGDNNILSSEKLSHTHSCATSPPPPLLSAASLHQEKTSYVYGCLKDVVTPCSSAPDTGMTVQESAVLAPSSGAQPGQLQETMWMDMDGETYNPLGHINLGYGIITMETDCCPNPAQYGV